MAHAKSVADVYKSVVNDVIEGVREAFLDDGMDDQVLQELRQLWESKVAQSKSIEPAAVPVVNQQQTLYYPHLAANQQRQQQLLQQHHPIQQQQHMMNLSSGAINLQHSQQHPVHIQGPVQMNMARKIMVIPSISSDMQPSSTVQGVSNPLSNMRCLVRQQGPYIIQTANGQLIRSNQPFQATNAGMHNIVTSDGKTTLNAQSVSYPVQLDGTNDSSSDDDEDVDDDEQNNDDDDDPGEEEEPLNSADDISDTDPTEVFDVENVVVCQFEKINRSKNKWKFHLKDGIMNLSGKDFVFQKANGEADW